MRRAVIDIGTNTVKLLVADVRDRQLFSLASTDRTTRLGEGLAAQAPGLQSSHLPELTAAGETPAPPRLSRVAIARTIQAIDDFLGEARRLGAQDVLALTTSAARDAENRDEFLDGVRDKCGLEVRVVTGEREAELIFSGVSSDPEWSDEPILVLDVGGGSAEFIQGQRSKIERFQSLPLGAVRLTEQYRENYDALVEFLRQTLRRSLDDYNARDRKMIGTGGTITTLARVHVVGGVYPAFAQRSGRATTHEVDHSILTIKNLRALVDRLRALPLAERRKVPGLPPERADIIVAGGTVFLVAMELLGAAELTVSVRNLRYGALLEARSF
jgi:exopolyphosphatase/guanosine-5'-triphosphate,3'-diphosphate pyrophosphatase